MTDMPALRPALILAEDNPRDRDYLREILSSYDISACANGREALSLACEHEEAWVITDVQMPELSGIELARALWTARPLARIVFWSQFRDELYVRSLAQLVPPDTVYGYVLKDNPAETLLKAVEAVFTDSQCWLDAKLRPVQARVRHKHSSISDAEFEVLIDIALGLTDQAIAQRRYLSRRGVQNRLRSLYSKLGVDREFAADGGNDLFNLRARAVSMALRRGLINTHEVEQAEEPLQAWLREAR